MSIRLMARARKTILARLKRGPQKLLLQPKRPRAPRYSLVAHVRLTRLESETETNGQILDLNLFGCRVNISDPLSAGSKLRIRISRGGVSVAAVGHVAYARKEEMGIVFAKIEENDLLVLDSWIAELRDKKHNELIHQARCERLVSH